MSDAAAEMGLAELKGFPRHTLALYEALLEDAKVENVDGTEMTVFRGSMTKTYNKVGCSQTYYSDIWHVLEDHGCITVLQRGARSVDSVIILHQAPSPERLQRRTTKDMTRRHTPHDILEQRVSNIEAMMGGLKLDELARNFEHRLTKLEQESINAKTTK